MTRTMIRDEDWAQIEPLLPKKSTARGRPSIHNRIIVEGILWVLRTGAPWRDLPETFPPWKTVYTRFWRWSKQGVWDSVWERLKKDADHESHIQDSSMVRVHQHACRAFCKTDQPKANMGRSRGCGCDFEDVP